MAATKLRLVSALAAAAVVLGLGAGLAEGTAGAASDHGTVTAAGQAAPQVGDPKAKPRTDDMGWQF
ncbi:hypothetical protein [Kitasatospora sp. NPDC094011]|uniref:hypothetical protein n=1 Tax=Kitasatospora sp. NPDC094011 TaxID=3364090 RepID=UPI0037FA6657